MRYNKIRKMDISNGEGIRVSLFTQGCHFHCEECFNSETHDFNGGKAFTDQEIDLIIELSKNDTIKGLSILGGEPLEKINIEMLTKLCQKFKATFPNKTIWLWTGFILFDEVNYPELFKYIDVIVDGQFKKELHDFRLKWRGSSNQRVIDMKETLKQNRIILYENA